MFRNSRLFLAFNKDSHPGSTVNPRRFFGNARFPRILSLALIALNAFVSSAFVAHVQADDWSRFRGPNGSGISTESKPVAEQWSATQNLLWKSSLPGEGVSSPIVVGDRIFVTCYSGYGLDRDEPGDIKNLKRHLVCLDKKTGEVVWNKTVDAVLPEDPYSGIGVTAHGYASHTPVSDGTHVYVFFGKSGVFAFDLQGNQKWQASVGTSSDPWAWGSASSPIVYKDLLIVTASAESQSLVALDTKTGKQVWSETASGFNGLWGTPALAKIDDSRTDIVIGAPYEVWGFDPTNGKLIWYCEASEAEQAHTSAVVDKGIVYVVTGRGGGSIAVRAGGKDDVTKSNILWKGSDSARFGSPLVYNGKIYLVSGGIVTTIDAATGKKDSQTRLDGGKANTGSGGEAEGGGRRGGGMGGTDYASPVIADGKLYYINSSGDMFVLKIGEKLEQIAVNRVTDANETFNGTPAISDGSIFIRSNKNLYCIGSK